MNRIGRKLPFLSFFAAFLCGLLCACQPDSALSQSAPSETSAQRLLEEQRIDDTHDAFLINTGGQLGTLLITAELSSESKSDLRLFDCRTVPSSYANTQQATAQGSR